MSSPWLRPVTAGLDAARAPVPVFVRDDDAGWGDARLFELLDRFAAHSLPVDLAVITMELDSGVARELASRPGVGLHQHGLPTSTTSARGASTSSGPRATPPRSTPTSRPAASASPTCSARGSTRSSPRPGTAAPPTPATASPSSASTCSPAIGSGAPLGVMFHHAVMDAGDMRRGGELLGAIAGHERARPMPMMEAASAGAARAGAARVRRGRGLGDDGAL